MGGLAPPPDGTICNAYKSVAPSSDRKRDPASCPNAHRLCMSQERSGIVHPCSPSLYGSKGIERILHIVCVCLGIKKCQASSAQCVSLCVKKIFVKSALSIFLSFLPLDRLSGQSSGHCSPDFKILVRVNGALARLHSTAQELQNRGLSSPICTNKAHPACRQFESQSLEQVSVSGLVHSVS